MNFLKKTHVLLFIAKTTEMKCEEILYNKKPNSYQQLHAGISVWISKNDLMSNSSRF